MSDDRTDETRRLYETVAATYARVLPDTSYESPLDLGMVEQFIAGLPDVGLPVLDAGCGTGRMLRYLSARGVQDLVAVDLSPAMLAHARAASPAVPMRTADLRALPFADGSFRGALCWYAIIHSSGDDVARIIAELRRVVVPGGLVLLGFQAGAGEREVARAYGHDVTLRGVLHEPAEIARMLRDAGLAVTAVADREPVGIERDRQGFVLARCEP
jgi:SAM-dependent methyltransferase